MQTPEIAVTDEELSNDLVHVVVHRKNPCRVELEVKVTKALLQQARSAAIKDVKKEVSLPGFRKGKAPEEIVIKKYPADVERKLHRKIADLGFSEAQKLAKVPVLNNTAKIVFDLKKIDEKEAELLYAFDTEPSPPSIDPKEFTPKPIEKKEVGEKEIEEGIRQMTFFYAKWSAVEDRGIERGDFVIIDLDTVDQEKVTRVFDGVRFEVNPDRMASWMQKLILGAKAGDSLEGMSEPDETANEEDKQEFQPKKVRLYVRKVEKADLPEINDEFAKKIGSKDVASMREMVENVLKTQIEEKADRDLRDQINQFLSKEYVFDLPESLIEAEVEHRTLQALQNPKNKKQWEEASEEEKQKIKDHVKQEASQSLRLFYLAKKIVQDAKISITHQEVHSHAVELRKQHPVAANANEQLSKEEYAIALSSIVLKKAQDYILDAQKAS